MRHFLKMAANALALLLVSPLALLCMAEKLLSAGEAFFQLCTHVVAILPGPPGLFLRRAFYCLTLQECSLESHIGFGSLFAHRTAIVEKGVYLGPYCLIGSAHIRSNCFIGSRVSIVSGKNQHARGEDGQWLAADPSRFVQVVIAPNVWVGEGAIIMADVATGSLVAAGAVVSSSLPANAVVAGNPARVVKSLTAAAAAPSGGDERCAE